MAVTYGIDCGRLIDALDALGTRLHCNSFSTRGKQQTKEVDLFKQAIGRSEHSKALERFCKELFQGISSCNAEPAASTDDRRERSYQLFYERRIGCLKELWNDFHGILQLPQPDPLWTQIVNRLLFNQDLVRCIGEDVRREHQPTLSAVSATDELGSDEENIIRYIAGYIPYKLMKVYEKKDTQEDANVLDCLSEMAISGPVDDFYAYTQEWTRAINRGGLFEVKDSVFTFFRKLDILMRAVLPQHLLGGSVSKEGVHARILNDQDLLFNWDILTGQLSHQKAIVLLQEIIDLWLTIRGHAFAKQLMEEHKADKEKVTRKSKSFRGQMK